MKTSAILVVVAALVLLAGALACEGDEDRRSDAGSSVLLLHGNVDLRDAQLAFFGQERIAEVLVEEGDAVEPGQVLARQERARLDAALAAAGARVRAQAAVVERLHNGTRPQEIAQARAQADAAVARLTNAERELVRLQSTAESGASSAQALDDARARLDVERAAREVSAETLALALEGPRREDVTAAEAQLDALRAEVELLQRQLYDSELRAPSPGVVQSRLLEPGEMASPERPVLTLALTEPKWVRAWVPEPDLARVSGGLLAVVRSDAFGGRDYEGRVGFVSPVAEFTPKAVETEELRTKLVYEVHVLVQDPDNELRLGMPVTVEVSTKTAGESQR